MFVKSKENYFLQYNDLCIILTVSILNVDSLSTRALSKCREKTTFKITIVNVTVESGWAIIVNVLTKNSS